MSFLADRLPATPMASSLIVPDDINLVMPALWEHKAVNAKNFRAVESDGLAKVFPRYAGQIAIYQNFLARLQSGAMTFVNSDTCERLYFTVDFDPRLAQETIDRAVDVVRATRAGSCYPARSGIKGLSLSHVFSPREMRALWLKSSTRLPIRSSTRWCRS